MDLPQLSGEPFTTDGGMETDLIFHAGFELPRFASFVLLDDERGREALLAYYAPYVEIARSHSVGLILDTPTWRANPDWGARLGYSLERLDEVNRTAVRLVQDIQDSAGDGSPPIVVSGCLGPRGDGYGAEELMVAREAQDYHAFQVAALNHSHADMVTALTLTYAEEAIGIVRAAEAADVPVAVSFTVETDGRLPSGEPLLRAIARIDAETESGGAYFMVNCAHPTHIARALADDGDRAWLDRIRGLRVNASEKSHAELDASEELDEGDPLALAAGSHALAERLPKLTILGGCCGTDPRHIRAICAARPPQSEA